MATEPKLLTRWHQVYSRVVVRVTEVPPEVIIRFEDGSYVVVEGDPIEAPDVYTLWRGRVIDKAEYERQVDAKVHAELAADEETEMSIGVESDRLLTREEAAKLLKRRAHFEHWEDAVGKTVSRIEEIKAPGGSSIVAIEFEDGATLAIGGGVTRDADCYVEPLDEEMLASWREDAS